MEVNDDSTFSELEIDTLQEIMNIAFGQASADLAEVINVFIVLSVPALKLKKAVSLSEFIRVEIGDLKDFKIVEQSYWGKSKGVALLAFPHEAELELIAMFREDSDMGIDSDISDELDNEMLIEIGNILIGACVSKMAELLKDVVTFVPPRVITGEQLSEAFVENRFEREARVILLKTLFQIEGRELSGHLFLVNSLDSIHTLKDALRAFWKQYE
ncbi:chemotaxis protein CheC [Candidatus Magnetominusculus dajiuhuensis]|uniref:chemotaxis protein CheC n=1 Tax=Candidatus Magnetominusculus dajiuhuensis TaxID=3137712 RepID=UPI003B43D1D9